MSDPPPKLEPATDVDRRIFQKLISNLDIDSLADFIFLLLLKIKSRLSL